MNTFLFAWNPKRWHWEDLEEAIFRIDQVGYTTEKWTVKSHKQIKVGDRVFLMRLGQEPKGIIASGFVSSLPFLSDHYIEGKDPIYRVMINFEIILNSEIEEILKYETLNTGNLAQVNWTPHSSGYEIKSQFTDELEMLWFNLLKAKNNVVLSKEEKEIDQTLYNEGYANDVLTTIYERNPYARKLCIEHYGLICSVCNLNFEKYYGDIGQGFIHVHHLKPISEIGKDYQIDPINDLRPLCPNCHAMIHKRKEPFSIDELKDIISKNKLSREEENLE